MALALLLAALPALYWSQPAATAPALKQAGIERILVPADAASWQGTGIEARALPTADLAARDALPAPGLLAGAANAALLRPVIDANGWRIRRQPSARYAYELPAGAAPLAAAEAFAYGADAVLTIVPADLDALGRMLAFLSSLPPSPLPDVADVAVIDDGSSGAGELLKRLHRRNLLVETVRPSAGPQGHAVTVGPRDLSAPGDDADARALRVRQRLGDDHRSLRLYGSEVVLARLTGDTARRRLHLLNYGGRPAEGLRVRLLGSWTAAEALVAGRGRVALDDYARRQGATEFSLPWLETYAVVDLQPAKD